MRFRVYVQRLTTYQVKCGSEQEARAIVWELEEREGARPADGPGIMKLDETLSVTDRGPEAAQSLAVLARGPG